MDTEPRDPGLRYADHASWHRLRALLHERLGVDVDREPEERFERWEGHAVHVDDWAPCAPDGDGTPPRGTVLLVHGGGGHGRLLAPLCHALSARGYRCLAPDLPGYGLTRARRGWRGDYEDWVALIAWLAGRVPGPVALLGLSMGGLTAVHAAQRRPVAGVVATTLLDLADPESLRRAARWRWLGRLSVRGFRSLPGVVDALAAPLGWVTPLRALVADPVLARFLTRDPLIGRRLVPLRLFRTASAHRPRDEALPVSCPVALFHPGADAWTPTQLSRAVLDRIEAPEKRFLELPGGSHAPYEAPARQVLVDASAGFLDAAFRRPGAAGHPGTAA